MWLVSLAQHSAWLRAAERPEKPSYSKRTARPQPRYMPACGAENGASDDSGRLHPQYRSLVRRRGSISPRPAKAPRRRRPLPMRNAYDTVYISYGSRRTLGGLAIILVTGATGTVGRPLVELLAAEGAGVRAVTRDPKAAGLPAGVEVVEGDPSRPGTIAPFLEGATGLFVNPRSVGSGISELLGLAQERGGKRVTSSTGRTRPSPNQPSTSGTWPRRAPARCSPAWWRRSSAAPHAPTPSGSPTTPRPSGAEGRPARQAQRAERRAARRVTIGAWTAPGSTAGCGRCGW